MSIHFEGSRQFRQLTPEQVSARLGDATFLVGCLKDAEVSSATPTRAVWKMKPGFSFIRTTLDTTLDVLENVPGASTRYRLASSGIGATATVEVTIAYAASDGGTAVHWAADVTQLTGLLKMVPKSLIQSAANQEIDRTWAVIEEKLAGP